jgi:hypothetical protein
VLSVNDSEQLGDGVGFHGPRIPGRLGPIDTPKDELTADGIADHVDGRQKVGIVKVDRLKGRLVEERDTNVVERPNNKPGPVRLGDRNGGGGEKARVR